jgi:uncharacterized membrane protein YcfT
MTISRKPAAGARAASRYGWVDIAKGICIVAVVCLYTFNALHERQLDPGWLSTWTAFAKPFRMPDFFLISGLFLVKVIDRPWRSYLDTKVLHYFYFILLWSFLIFVWNFGARFGELGVWRSFKLFVYLVYRPDAMLWFIQTLSLYFVVTRLLRAMPMFVMLPVAFVMRVSEYHTGIYPIDWFGEFYVFFLCGYYFARHWFAIADWAADHRKVAWGVLPVWVVANQLMVASGATQNPVVLVATGMVGIVAVIVLASLISEARWAAPLRYLGHHSIVVYLGFYLPLQAMANAYQREGAQWNVHLLGALLVVSSIGAAAALHAATRRTALRFLFERPAWCRLVSHSKKSPRDAAPASA